MKRYAGWWSNKPLGGDLALDLLTVVEKSSPEQAIRTLRDLLRSRDIGEAYSAMGIWNYIMNVGKEDQKRVFSKFASEIRTAARLIILRIETAEETQVYGEETDDDDALEWSNPTVSKYLEGYKQGKLFSDVGYKESSLKKAKQDPIFRKRLIASISFSLPNSESREIEQSLADIYAAIRVLKFKTKPLDPLLKKQVGSFEDNFENLRAILMRYV